jgi:WD40 repeat protein
MSLCVVQSKALAAVPPIAETRRTYCSYKIPRSNVQTRVQRQGERVVFPPGRLGKSVPRSVLCSALLSSENDCLLPCGVQAETLVSYADLIGRCGETLTAVQQAHTGAVGALSFLGEDKVLSAGMDKTVSIWKICTNGLEIEKRIILSGGPCHSVLIGDDEDSVLMGTHAKTILSWAPSKGDLDSEAYSVVDQNHCGWVRTLASNGRWLFSAACNEIKQFDAARVVPSPVATSRLDKGDILSLVCTKDALYAGTVDGCLYSFCISKNGALQLKASHTKAHAGRITDLVIHRGLLLSSSYDGSIKSWSLDDLEIVDIVSQAHGGERVSCLAMGNSGVLYSGGSDGALRAWDPNLLKEIDTICTHDQPIRSLSVNDSGSSLCLGTAEGLLVLIQTNTM